MTELLQCINDIVWGIPTLMIMIGVGMYITLGSRFVQLRFFPLAIKRFLFSFSGKAPQDDNGVSPFRALCTALAATVGTGNIAGVAGAVAIGGPGAVFWMWICGFLGMGTKFAEAVLAVKFRDLNRRGEWVGGPMYMIRNGMGIKWDWLGRLYCFFGVVAAFGVGNATQINTVTGGVNAIAKQLGFDESIYISLTVGILIAMLLSSVLLGGMKRIGQFTQMLVPFASVAYILLCAAVLFLRRDMLLPAFRSIVYGAFNPRSVTGGILGSCFLVLRTGASRGIFTNEAGMGTASIAHSAADVKHPVEQGLMGIIEVFIDTIVICTLTALVILCSGVSVPYGTDPGVALSMDAFSEVLGPWVQIVLTLALSAFAIATVIGWGFYGGRCAQYLFGDGSWNVFIWVQIAATVLGAVIGTQTVWTLAEIVNALMAIPNLIALAYLSPRLFRSIENFKNNRSRC